MWQIAQTRNIDVAVSLFMLTSASKDNKLGRTIAHNIIVMTD